MSQRMTFLHPTRLGNRSSGPVTKPTDPTCKAWRPGGLPNLDMSIAPTTDAGGYGFVPARMRSVPPEMTLYKEAHWPQSVSQSLAVRVWPSVGLTVNPPWLTSRHSLVLAETSTLDSAWRVVPFKSNPPSLSCLFINCPRPGEGVFAWTVVIVSSRRRHVSAYYRGRRNRLTS